MALSKPYQHQPDAIASYNYIDIATGTGYAPFYLVDLNDDVLSLIYNAIYAKIGYLPLNNTIDYDFDLTFGRPFNIIGDIFISIPIMFYQRGAGTPTIAITITIYKVVGASETSLGTDTETISGGYLSDSGSTKFYALKKILSNTTFGAEDKLRINVTSGNISTANSGAIMGCDPKNRIDVEIDAGAGLQSYIADSSQSIINIPVKVDL